MPPPAARNRISFRQSERRETGENDPASPPDHCRTADFPSQKETLIVDCCNKGYDM
jgi:hypothetical protein